MGAFNERTVPFVIREGSLESSNERQRKLHIVVWQRIEKKTGKVDNTSM